MSFILAKFSADNNNLGGKILKAEHKEMMKRRKRNIKLTLSYDGTAYHGFQRQNKVVAVQNVLENVLFKLFGDSIELAAAGRTDAGVHALGQVVNFFTDGTIPVKNVVYAANRLLPEDIVILKAEEADRNFSALHSVKSKIYLYKVYQSEFADPFLTRHYWHVNKSLDLKAMQYALQFLQGEHDFSSFRSAGGNDTSPVRKLYEISCRREGNTYIFKFWGSGFLYHMVRNIVGLVINIGLHRVDKDAMPEILAAKNRALAGKMAPANGLYLAKVFY